MPTQCPVLNLLNTLSKRWALHILKSIGEGAQQFNDIKRAIPHISPKILSERLSDLEQASFIARTITNAKPIKISYAFTQYGQSLAQELQRINSWAIANKDMLLKK